MAFLLLVTGCQHELKHHDWSSYDGPGKQYFQAEELELGYIDDPIEPTNRAMAAFNHGLMVGVVYPLSWGYRAIFPKPVRVGIRRVFHNLLYPLRLMNNLLQGKGGGAWVETKRFAVNTTVGILGFRDPATDWGIGESREDFGQTMGVWGWRDTTYLTLPFLGPSTVRDGSGTAGDGFSDPLFHIAPPAVLLRSGREAVDGILAYRSFVAANYDPYTLARRLFVLNRNLIIDDYVYDAPAEVTGETETLGAIYLAPDDEYFAARARTHRVQLPGDRGALEYSLWLQDEPRPLVFFIPGTGGHRIGGSALAVAEAAFQDSGNSVITISSTFNYEFIAGGSSSHYPGFAPIDSLDVHVALTAIEADVLRRYPGRFTEERRLGGISLGGLHTLYIAARGAGPEGDLLEFDGYLALNAPVSLRHAMRTLDSYANAPLAFPEETREEEVEGILRKVAFLAQGGIRPNQPIPISRLEARFLIGMSFRLNLGDIIYQTTLEHPRGVLQTERSDWRRTSAYQEISRYSFMEYVYAWVLPYLAEVREDITFSEAGAERIFELCDLRSIEDALLANDRILFVTNRNDTLLRPEDIAWAERVFGEDALFFERGGHVGNLHLEDVQQVIRERFAATLGQAP